MSRQGATPAIAPRLAAVLTLATGLSVLPVRLPAAQAAVRPAAVSIEARNTTAQGITESTGEQLAKARAILEEIVALQEPRTVENTLGRLNDLAIQLDAAGNWARLAESVHPDSAVRRAAEEASRQVRAFSIALSLNREVYGALAAVDTTGADAVTRRHLELLLRDFRRAGVDKDAETRERIQALRDSLVRLGQEFGRNIREGRRFIHLADAKELEGLPPDYVAAHPPDSSGRIRITTDYPDLIPFMNYAKNGEARRRLHMEFLNRAYPRNREVLQRLLAGRQQLARLLGYETWAEYAYADKMAKSPAEVEKFIAALDQATRKRADEDYRLLLERKRREDPGAQVVHDWERRYYSEQVRAERFRLDPEELRAYFNYAQAKQGILDLTSALFDVRYQRVPDAGTWHPEVECYEVREADRLLGRFYLDMHPRPGKYSHAAHFRLVTGVAGRHVPEGVLVCNFPRPDSSGVALMEHEDFETMLHEFGHLLHHILGGQQPWVERSGVATEQDFIETPSSLLEEWAADARVLQGFARHYRTAQLIPAELVRRLRAARDFGNGLYVRQQTYYSALSLDCYRRPAAGIDLDMLSAELQERYTPWPFTPGTHMYASFTHLESYTAMYYTYMWSLVIAKDLFGRFDPRNLLDPKVATEYRRKVLDPGGTKDAADLVKDFLGRAYDFKAFEAWLNRGAGS